MNKSKLDRLDLLLTPRQRMARHEELQAVERMSPLEAIDAVDRISSKYNALAEANQRSSSSASGASSGPRPMTT